MGQGGFIKIVFQIYILSAVLFSIGCSGFKSLTVAPLSGSQTSTSTTQPVVAPSQPVLTQPTVTPPTVTPPSVTQPIVTPPPVTPIQTVRANCAVEGITILDGQSLTLFQSTSVSYGDTCKTESRLCDNGNLSGSFLASTCQVQGPAACSFNGQTISNGQSVLGFIWSSVRYGQDCQSEARTCVNGNLSGSASYSTCFVQPIADPLIASLNQRVASGDQALDFVIGDVCVDQNNHVIAGDPAVCASHRNIQIGEKFPYLVSDFDTTNGQRYQANFSYPVPGVDGTLKVMTAKNLQGPLDSSFQFRFDPSRDGYDLMETTSGNFSFIRTSDGGCYDQAWQSNLTQLSGGWILFQPNAGSGSSSHPRWHVELTDSAPAGCATNFADHVLDVWNAPAPVTFESKKTLSSIVTYDFYSDQLSAKNTGMERYYFTREYGFTRWEAWIPLSRCQDPNFAGSPAATGQGVLCDPNNPANPISHRCSNSNISGLDSWGGQTWVRVDCRDTTNYLALNQPVIPLDGSMAQSTHRVDIDLSVLFPWVKPLGNNPVNLIGSLRSNQSITASGIVRSPSGAYYLNLQSNGNLVLYRSDQTVMWYTSAGANLVMQSDGNLVSYDNAGQARWTTSTGNNPGAMLAVQDDGNLVIYSAQGGVLWALN